MSPYETATVFAAGPYPSAGENGVVEFHAVIQYSMYRTPATGAPVKVSVLTHVAHPPGLKLAIVARCVQVLPSADVQMV